MELMVMAELGYDKKDPINAGVQSYELMGCSAGVTVHRVVYKCLISGEMYSFVTSLTNVPPGLIAYLYKTRWDIEKIFDQVKNKLVEKKAWATSGTAKNMQAQFVCLSHNLMLIFNNVLKKKALKMRLKIIDVIRDLIKSSPIAKIGEINCQFFLQRPDGLLSCR